MTPGPRIELAEGFLLRAPKDQGDPHGLPRRSIVVPERADVDRLAEALQHRVDIFRIDLHAAEVDLLARAAPEVEPPTTIDESDVSSAEPSVAHGLGGEIVPSEVAAHERRCVDPDEARLARLAGLAALRRREPLARLQHRDDAAPGPTDQAVCGDDV